MCECSSKLFHDEPRMKSVPDNSFQRNPFFLEGWCVATGKPTKLSALTCQPLRSQVGMTVLIDQSGHLFGKKKCSIKDLIVNKEAGLANILMESYGPHMC